MNSICLYQKCIFAVAMNKEKYPLKTDYTMLISNSIVMDRMRQRRQWLIIFALFSHFSYFSPYLH